MKSSSKRTTSCDYGKILQRRRLQKGNDVRASSSSNPPTEARSWFSVFTQKRTSKQLDTMPPQGDDVEHHHCLVQPLQISPKVFTREMGTHGADFRQYPRLGSLCGPKYRDGVHTHKLPRYWPPKSIPYVLLVIVIYGGRYLV